MGELIKIPLKSAIIGPPAKRLLDGVSESVVCFCVELVKLLPLRQYSVDMSLCLSSHEHTH